MSLLLNWTVLSTESAIDTNEDNRATILFVKVMIIHDSSLPIFNYISKEGIVDMFIGKGLNHHQYEPLFHKTSQYSQMKLLRYSLQWKKKGKSQALRAYTLYTARGTCLYMCVSKSVTSIVSSIEVKVQWQGKQHRASFTALINLADRTGTQIWSAQEKLAKKLWNYSWFNIWYSYKGLVRV